MPDPLIDVNKNVTLYHTPDSTLNELLTFKFQTNNSTLIELSQIESFINHNLLNKDTWSKVDKYIEKKLSENILDLNFLFYLKHRYPTKEDLYKKIDDLYMKYSETDNYSWITWFEENKHTISIADNIQLGKENCIPSRYLLYYNLKKIKPIKTTIQTHSYIVQNDNFTNLSLGTDVFLYKNLNLKLLENNITVENKTDKKEPLTINISKL